MDRVSSPFATGVSFVPGELPTGSAAEYLRRSIHRRQETYAFAVRFVAPAEQVSARLSAWLGAPEDDGEGGCVLRGSVSDPPEWLAVRPAMAGYEFTVHGPDELGAAVRELGGRLSRAGADAPEREALGDGLAQT